MAASLSNSLFDLAASWCLCRLFMAVRCGICSDSSVEIVTDAGVIRRVELLSSPRLLVLGTRVSNITVTARDRTISSFSVRAWWNRAFSWVLTMPLADFATHGNISMGAAVPVHFSGCSSLNSGGYTSFTSHERACQNLRCLAAYAFWDGYLSVSLRL